MKNAKKVKTLLNAIRCDLIILQEEIPIDILNNCFGSPGLEAYQRIETHINNCMALIRDFTPKHEQEKKISWVLLELVNLDKKEKLMDAVKTM